MVTASGNRAALAVLVCACVLGTRARADRRAFVSTYEYQTMPKGGIDLELWSEEARPTLGEDGQANTFKFEVEYGITDHWDIALYQVFNQASSDDATKVVAFHHAQTKLESRYRFGERGEWGVDPLVYLEVVKATGEDAYEVEGKVILAHDFGELTAVLNLIGEWEREDGANKMIPGWAAGLTYEFAPQFKLGAEGFGEAEKKAGEWETKAWAGPALSWAPSGRLWIAVGAGFGLTEEADDLRVQGILGIGL